MFVCLFWDVHWFALCYEIYFINRSLKMMSDVSCCLLHLRNIEWAPPILGPRHLNTQIKCPWSLFIVLGDGGWQAVHLSLTQADPQHFRWIPVWVYNAGPCRAGTYSNTHRIKPFSDFILWVYSSVVLISSGCWVRCSWMFLENKTWFLKVSYSTFDVCHICNTLGYVMLVRQFKCWCFYFYLQQHQQTLLNQLREVTGTTDVQLLQQALQVHHHH